MPHQPRPPFSGVAIQPGVDRVRIARFEQGVLGHPMGALPSGNLERGNLEQRRTPLAHIGSSVVIPAVFELASLLPAHYHRPSLGHLILLFQGDDDGHSKSLPILIVKGH
jgi:hypothetical protein